MDVAAKYHLAIPLNTDCGKKQDNANSLFRGLALYLQEPYPTLIGSGILIAHFNCCQAIAE